MSALTATDLSILREYAETGNRLLYWNYLSQINGNDGYGTLALGVVRNDSLPGRVANTYAQDYAAQQSEKGSRFANAELSERQWDAFGQSLLKQDLSRRSYWMSYDRPDLALNLPGTDVMLAHDRAFEQHALDPNCWTPRVLLQAALEKSGPPQLEKIWTNMLDNRAVGLSRAYNTTVDAYTHMDMAAATRYIATLTALESVQLLEGRSAVDPNLIGGRSFYAMYFERERKWLDIAAVDGRLDTREVRDPARLEELNDTRALRLERQQKATQFHPDDPYRSITPSPRTVSVDPPPGDTLAATRLADIGPGHPDHALLQQVRAGVHALDAQTGRSPDAYSERMVASVMALARQNGIDRADHVVLNTPTAESPGGSTVFVVQGALNDPAHLRASMPTDTAVQAPVEHSLQLLHSAHRTQEQVNAQSLQQQIDAQTQTQTQHGALRMG